eukprot:179695_1
MQSYSRLMLYIIAGWIVLSIITWLCYESFWGWTVAYSDLIPSTDDFKISSQYKYTLDIEALFYETDVSSMFINGMVEHYWVHQWDIIRSVKATRFSLNSFNIPMIVKKYLGQFNTYLGLGSVASNKNYNKFIWGDILLLVTATSHSWNKTIALVIAGDDEYCQRRWDILGSDMLIKSITRNRSYYDYHSANYVYDYRFNALPFNCSSVPVIASQFYNPSLPSHIVYLPLFIHRKQGNYTHLHHKIFKPFSARTLIFNAIINTASGWRQSIDFWENLNQMTFALKSIVETSAMNNSLYQRTISNSRYTLCPAGNNPQTYRLWESLLFGSIPIVAIDLEYFTHSCFNSYTHFIHHQFPIAYHQYLMKLSQTQCETMMICWSKQNANYLLQQDLNQFIPLIVLTQWDSTLFLRKINDMNSMGDAYWDRFQQKAAQWREQSTQRALRQILENVLHYVDALYSTENVTPKKTYPAAQIFASYQQHLSAFLRKENLNITMVVYSCYRADSVALLNKAIISIFKYIDLGFIAKFVIMELCGYPLGGDLLQQRYGTLFDIMRYKDRWQNKVNDAGGKVNSSGTTIYKAMSYSMEKLQNPWILHLVNYPQFKSAGFIQEAFQFYRTLAMETTDRSLMYNIVLHCRQGVHSNGWTDAEVIFAPSFAYNKLKPLKSRMRSHYCRHTFNQTKLVVL